MHYNTHRDRDQLTPREAEVLELTVDGECTKMVAHKLGISCRTVEIYRASVQHKMHFASMAKLISHQAEARGHARAMAGLMLR